MSSGLGAAVGIAAVIFIVIMGIAVLFWLASYILRSAALYEIATRRNIKCPWLAWIPLAYNWTLGAVADLQDAKEGKTGYWRWIMTGAAVLTAGSSGSDSSSAVTTVTKIINGNITEITETTNLFGPLSLISGSIAGLLGIAVIVLRFICIYKLFKSCRPEKATLYTVLSILPLAMPILMMCVRKYDDGRRVG